MSVQEKQFFHQQHLRTCVNIGFCIQISILSAHSSTLFLSLGVEDSRNDVRGRSSKRVGNFLQKSRFFLMQAYFSEEVIQSI